MINREQVTQDILPIMEVVFSGGPSQDCAPDFIMGNNSVIYLIARSLWLQES